MNRSDKERLIIKLYREDRNWSYIAEASHSSMSTIKKVIDRHEQPKVPKAKNVESKALQMYNKNYTPLQVAIKLNITADEAVNYQIEFWKLKGMTWLREMYEQYKELSSRIVSRIYDLGISEFSTEKLVTTLHLASTLPQMHTQFEDLTKKIQDKQSAYQAMQKESSNIQRRLFNDREKYHTLQNSIRVMTQEKEDLKRETDKMYSIIAEIKSSKTYDRAKEKISNAVKEVLGDKNTLLHAAAVSIIRASSENPGFTTLVNLTSLDRAFTHLLYTPDGKTEPELIRDAKIIYDNLMDVVDELVIDRWNKS